MNFRKKFCWISGLMIAFTIVGCMHGESFVEDPATESAAKNSDDDYTKIQESALYEIKKISEECNSFMHRVVNQQSKNLKDLERVAGGKMRKNDLKKLEEKIKKLRVRLKNFSFE